MFIVKDAVIHTLIDWLIDCLLAWLIDWLVCGNEGNLFVIREFYPDSYDVTVKMRSKLFASISPILELVRQREYVSAAEIMVLVTEKIVNSEY